MQHMQQQRHFQLKWSEEQQDLLHRFYDYKKSYYEVSTRDPEIETRLRDCILRGDLKGVKRSTMT